MIASEPFRADHLIEIDVQDAQLSLRPVAVEVGAAYEAAGNAYTLRQEGRIIICGGIAQSELGLHLWSVVAQVASLLVVHGAVGRFIGMFGHLHLNATVPVEFWKGCRWLDLLGFARVGTLRGYVEGADHYRYLRQGVRA